MISGALGEYDVDIVVALTDIDGAPAITVTATAPVPLVGFWGVGSMTVYARALVEDDRG